MTKKKNTKKKARNKKIDLDWVVLVLIGLFYFIIGFGFAYPGLFHLIFKRWKRSLAITAIYYIITIPVFLSLFSTVVGSCLLIPYFALVFGIILYDAYLIYNGKPALLEGHS